MSLQYEGEQTQDVRQQMRIPESLNVEFSTSEKLPVEHHLQPPHPVMMQVPNRIVVAVQEDHDDSWLNRPRDLEFTHSGPMESIQLKDPPQVLTLDFLEPLQPTNQHSQVTEEGSSHSGSRRRRCTSESSALRNHNQINKIDVLLSSSTPSPGGPIRVCPPLVSPEDGQIRYSFGYMLSYVRCTTRRGYELLLSMLDGNHSRTALATLDVNLDITPSDVSTGDAAGLRRQIMKLNRRLMLLEESNKQRSRREIVFYSLTVAFWLVRTWIWLRR